MTQAHGPSLALWLGYWRLMRRYHRFTSEGLEHLDGPGAKLIVGYHGRGVAHDLCLLSVTLYERLGYLPHGIVHAAAKNLPLGGRVVRELGFVTGGDDSLAEVVARGEHVICTPGGTKEACRSFRRRYRVAWGHRVGYLRLALRHGMSVVPVAASGVDHTYWGLNDGYRTGKRLGMPLRLPLWAGVGLGGLFPFVPPFPARIRQRIGAPIPVDVDPQDEDALNRLHEQVVGRVQGLLDALTGASA